LLVPSTSSTSQASARSILIHLRFAYSYLTHLGLFQQALIIFKISLSERTIPKLLAKTIFFSIFNAHFSQKRLMTSATNKSYQEKVWLKHYNDLIAFQKATGKDYPRSADNSPKLYHWCKNQRRFYTKNLLAPHRAELLNKLNFRWNTLHHSFDKRFEQLLEFKKEHGTLHVSQVKYDKDSEMHRLSRWVNDTRRKYNENRLAMDRIIRLDKIGFVWNMEDERFANNLFKLKRYFKQNGHFDVPQTGRNKKLGEWVAQVRCRGLVKKHYINALNDIGFEWVGKKKRLQKAKSTMTNIDLKTKILKGRISAKKALKKVV